MVFRRIAEFAGIGDFVENLAVVTINATTEVSAVVGRHPELATAVRQNRGLLETFGSRSLSEVELDYICLHLCAALERRRSVEGQIRVIVACSGGVGMSQLLAETLRGRFDFEIVDVIPSHEASLLVATDADLMVSTAPLRGCPIKPAFPTFV